MRQLPCGCYFDRSDRGGLDEAGIAQLAEDVVASARVALERSPAGEPLHRGPEQATRDPGWWLLARRHEVECEFEISESRELAEQTAPRGAIEVDREPFGDHEDRLGGIGRELDRLDVAGD